MARRLRDQRGASAVEFALIVPLLILLVIGVAEFGHAYQVQGTLSAAAREGVRVMALQNDPAAARAAVQDAASSLRPAVPNARIAISTTCPANSGAGATTNVRVTVTYSMPYLTGFFGSGLQLRGTGVMRCNG